MRIDKLIETTFCTSRTGTKRILNSRQVRIDGKAEMNGRRNVDSNLHHIEIKGRKNIQTSHVYYLLNKPAGYVTAVKDRSRQTVIDLLEEKDRTAGLYPAGRLDRDTEGLVFLTDNGQLGYAMMQAKFKVAKVYEAVVNEAVTIDDVTAFAEGIEFLDGTVCQSAKLEILFSSADAGKVRLTITEGKFHQVKKMFLACGKKVTHLKRLSIGPLKLPEDLPIGAYRRLKDAELQALKPYFY